MGGGESWGENNSNIVKRGGIVKRKWVAVDVRIGEITPKRKKERKKLFLKKIKQKIKKTFPPLKAFFFEEKASISSFFTCATKTHDILSRFTSFFSLFSLPKIK